MKKQTKIKKFFKRIEGFFVRIKQRYIVHHLLKQEDKKLLLNTANTQIKPVSQ
jgi:hypothetical protein